MDDCVRFTSLLRVTKVDKSSRLRRSQGTIVAFLAVAFPCVAARAGVVGFNNLGGWTYNQSDTASRADLPTPDTIHITNLSSGEARSVFYNAPQPISEFVATFTYQALNAIGSADSGRGVTLTLHNDPRGPSALGIASSSLGYAGGTSTRIANSAAVTFQLVANSSGFYTGGLIGGGSPSVNPVNLLSGHPIDVTLEYDGFLLSETLVDTVTSDTLTRPNIFAGDIASLVGGPTAFVGFTASTNNGVDQYISNFSYAVPEPATLSLLAVAGAALLRRRHRTS